MSCWKICAARCAAAAVITAGVTIGSIASAQTITEYAIPTMLATPLGNTSGPFGIAPGPDGAIWFVEGFANKVGRITPSGTITEYPIPTANSNPQCIVRGPDGAMWFVEGDGNKIGRITTSGTTTEFANFQGGWPQCLTPGPDGNLWIADQGPKGGGAATGNGWISRITPSGTMTKFPIISQNAQPSWITAGPDGALWFTMGDVNKIGRITTSGVVTEYAIPTANAGIAGITDGPDGALWFTENVASKIGRITTSGAITEFPLAADTNPGFIASGPDGALWFTQPGLMPSFTGGAQNIGRITTGGTVTTYAIPTANSLPAMITNGPDGNLWFGEARGNKIAKLVLPPPPTQQIAQPPATQTSYSFSSGQMPTAAVATTVSGNFASATVTVTLDLSKVLGGGSFAAEGQFAAGYNIYVAALVPAGRMGLSTANWFVYKATSQANTWTWNVLGSPIAAYMTGIAANATNQVTINLLQNIDVSGLVGAEIYVGYGTDDADMLGNNRYRGVYIVQ